MPLTKEDRPNHNLDLEEYSLPEAEGATMSLGKLIEQYNGTEETLTPVLYAFSELGRGLTSEILRSELLSSNQVLRVELGLLAAYHILGPAVGLVEYALVEAVEFLSEQDLEEYPKRELYQTQALAMLYNSNRLEPVELLKALRFASPKVAEDFITMTASAKVDDTWVDIALRRAGDESKIQEMGLNFIIAKGSFDNVQGAAMVKILNSGLPKLAPLAAAALGCRYSGLRKYAELYETGETFIQKLPSRFIAWGQRFKNDRIAGLHGQFFELNGKYKLTGGRTFTNTVKGGKNQIIDALKDALDDSFDPLIQANAALSLMSYGIPAAAALGKLESLKDDKDSTDLVRDCAKLAHTAIQQRFSFFPNSYEFEREALRIAVTPVEN